MKYIYTKLRAWGILLLSSLILFQFIDNAHAQDNLEEIRKRRKVKSKTQKQNTQKSITPKNNEPKITNSIRQNKLRSDTLHGTVIDSISGESMTGAMVQVDGTQNGAICDGNGKFKLYLPKGKSFTLIIKYIGYTEKKIPVNGQIDDLDILISPDGIVLDEVVVSASRVDEKLKESPIAIKKVGLMEIRNKPSMNAIDLASNISAIDLTTTGFVLRTLNARGFNTTQSPRFLNRIDGMEMCVPILGIQMGSLSSVSDLDYENMEVVTGPASSLYGPNAMNGMVSIKTKDPFTYTGLSYRMRTGFSNVNAPNFNHNPLADISDIYQTSKIENSIAPFYEMGFRYAHVFNPKWAYKINVAYLAAKEMVATDTTDIATYSSRYNIPGEFGQGYNGVNVYGDEISSMNYIKIQNIPENIRLARTGYREIELINQNTNMLNTSIALHYKPNIVTNISFNSRLSYGNFVAQVGNNRYQMSNYIFLQNKLELNRNGLNIRFYVNSESGGEVYDLQVMALILNRSWKSDEQALSQFQWAYSGEASDWLKKYNGQILNPYDVRASRVFMDQDNNGFADFLQTNGFSAEQVNFLRGKKRYNYGTPEFSETFAKVKNTYARQGGARFYGVSNLLNLEGSYHLNESWKYLDQLGINVLIGAGIRFTHVHTKGNVFADSTSGGILNREADAYLQLQKQLFNKIKLIGALRYDKHENFKGQISPRIAAIINLGKQDFHTLRLTAQTAFRNPTFQDQYLSVSTRLPQKVLGNRSDIKEVYGLNNNVLSVDQFMQIVALLSSKDIDKAQAEFNKATPIPDLRPERLSCLEIGYRTTIIKKLNFDITTHYSIYYDLISYDFYFGPSAADLAKGKKYLEFNDIPNNNYRLYALALNNPTERQVFGINPELVYNYNSKITFNIGYAYSHYINSNNVSEERIARFNTSPHKVSASVYVRNLIANFNFMLKYRWVNGFFFGQGYVPTYSLVDLQVNYAIPKTKFQLAVGANNLLNFYHREIESGANIGGIYFLQLSYDGLLN